MGPPSPTRRSRGVAPGALNDRLPLPVVQPLENLRRAQLVAAVDEIHLVGIAREKIRFLGGRITATDYGDRVVPEEGAIADRAIRYALARVFDLTRNAELHGRAAGRDDCGR